MQATVQPEIFSPRFLVRCCSLSVFRTPRVRFSNGEKMPQRRPVCQPARRRWRSWMCHFSGSGKWALPMRGQLQAGARPPFTPALFVNGLRETTWFCLPACLPARILAFLVLRANGLFSQNTNPHFVRYDLLFRTRPCSPVE